MEHTDKIKSSYEDAINKLKVPMNKLVQWLLKED